MPQHLDPTDPLLRLLADYRQMADRHKASLDACLDLEGNVDYDKRHLYSRRERVAAVEARALLERVMPLLTERFTLPDGLTVTVPGSDCATFTLTTGRLDDNARSAFRHGQCHALARALCERTGWTMAVVIAQHCVADPDACGDYLVHDICACQLEHLIAVRPDGVHVDITGAHLPGTLPGYEDQQAIPVDDHVWSFIERSPAWRRPALDVARTFVTPLLASLDDPLCAAAEFFNTE
ncbi:hypothetical protein ACIG3E_32955 [Streptomyces sp. NPDC053474]|uniref:hypothetical protein n=1 Tax=Streptomyces sp. NPDC053474 TaxID=3365704 RepID=UPI0037D656FA